MLMETKDNKKNNRKIIITCLTILSMLLIISISIFLLKNNRNKDIIILSFGNDEKECNIEKTNLEEKNILEQYGNYQNLKIDKVTDIQKIKSEEINKKCSSEYFKYGIAFDKNFEQVILEEQINAHNLLNNQKTQLDLEEINRNFFVDEKLEKIPEEIYLFKTDSYYYENQKWIKLEEENGYKIRELEVSEEKLNEIIKQASQRLINMEEENGKYIYGFTTNTGQEMNDYNIVRHAGTVWSQVLAYNENPSDELKIHIERAIEYLINNFCVSYNQDINHIKMIEADEIVLGGDALTLLMLAEYENTFKENKYIETCNKIANGILSMQNDDGSFNHSYNLDLTLKEKTVTVFYDGEAIYALMKLYKILPREDIYEAVTKAIDFFIENNYVSHGDHWISYGMSEYIKYNQEDKYIKFALDNYFENRGSLSSTTRYNPTNSEMLLATYNTYLYLKQNNPENEIVKNFNISGLKKTINRTIKNLYKYYIEPEVAMYFECPDKVKYGFHSLDNRMRIDDIQHSMSAIIAYKNSDLY